MMRKEWIPLIVAAPIAASAVVVTRLSTHFGASEAVVLVAAFAFVAASLFTVRRPGAGWTAALALSLGVVLLAVPAASEPLVPLPAAAVAIAMLACFHFLFPLEATRAPFIGDGSRRGLRTFVRLIPFTALAMTVLGASWLVRLLLPDRLAASHELQGPVGPVIVALILVAALVCTGLARRAFHRTKDVEPGGALVPSRQGTTDVEAGP